METVSGPPVVLARKEERRVLKGHPWVFSNEIASSLTEHAPGDVVDVRDSRGNWVGRGTANPHSLIAVRLFSITPARPAGPDSGTLATRIQQADDYRGRVLSPLPAAYRVVHGEADFLPGLVVDRYDDVLAVQALTAGIDRRTEVVCDTLESLFSPRAIVMRNDSPLRQMEGLPQETRVSRGELQEPVTLQETPSPGLPPLSLRVDLLRGQKTGAYLDQRVNRAAAAPLLAGASVLDLFCYEGAWSLTAAAAGAVAVLGLDSSTRAVAAAIEAAGTNGLQSVCRFQEADVFQSLRQLHGEQASFDAVIVDPPAFIKSRAKRAEGRKGYLTVNRRAARLVRPGGWLISSSCSYHLSPADFVDMLATAARSAGRTLRLVELRGAAPDHPVLVSVPETAYLKCALCQVL